MNFKIKLLVCSLIAVLPCAGLIAQQSTPIIQVGQPLVTEANSSQPVFDGSTVQNELNYLKQRMRELENEVASRATGPAIGDNSVIERLDKLEAGSEKQTEALAKVDSKFDGVVHHSHKSPKLSFFGRIHLDYWAFPDVSPGIFPLESGGNPQDRINFRRMRIGVKGDLNDNMFYKFEGEFAGGAASSYRDALIGFKGLPCLQKVIIGNHKRPYGLDHLNSSRYNIFLERPFIVEAFNQDSRRLGISSNGVSEDQRFNWRYGVYNQELTQSKSGYVGDHYQSEVAARLASTFWYDESSGGRGYGHFAISGSLGYPDGLAGNANQAQYRTRPEARSNSRWIDTGRIAGADANMLVGLEYVLNIGAFQFVGEYMRSNVDRLSGFGPDVQFEGGYASVSYFLTGEHIPWDRKTGTIGRIKPFENFFSVCDCDGNAQQGIGAWQVAARYSFADLTDDNIIGGKAESLTLALNWYWNQNARVQFNWIMGDVDRQTAGGGDYDILGARVMVDF